MSTKFLQLVLLSSLVCLVPLTVLVVEQNTGISLLGIPSLSRTLEYNTLENDARSHTRHQVISEGLFPEERFAVSGQELTKQEIIYYHAGLLNCTGTAITTERLLAKKRAKVAQTFDTRQIGPFLKNYKNPCWKITRDRLGRRHSNKLHCLPYFYIAGLPKCGTSDLHAVVTAHPYITSDVKEPQWWSREAVGLPHHHSKEPDEGDDWRRRYFSLSDYNVRFNKSSPLVDEVVQGNYHPMVIVDGTPSTFWEMDRWPLYPGNENSMAPNFVLAHYIQSFTYQAKIILMMRNPTDRVYSHYFHRSKLGGYKPTREDFHFRITSAIDMMTSCFQERSLRECVYDPCVNHLDTGTARVPIRVGLYSVYLKDWLGVFPREQFKIIRFEDYAERRLDIADEIFEFLDVGPMPEVIKETLHMKSVENTRSNRYRGVGPMWNKTKQLLDSFYKPFNEELAELLSDEEFLWSSNT